MKFENIVTMLPSKKTAVGALLAAAVAVLPVSAQAEVVRIGQATATSLTFGPIYAAIELGYFEQEDIEIENLNFQGASVLMPQVANKEITIGFPGPDPLIVSHQPGRDPLPLKFFYNGARESIWEFLVLEESPLQSLADLNGKTIGVGALANANVPITRAMLKEIGLEATDYSFLPIGVGAPAFRATENGDVDVYNTFDTNIAAFESTGIALRRLPQDQKYKDLFSNGFIAHEDTVRDQPELLAGFGRALTKGIIVCEENPEFCVTNFYAHLPELRPTGLSDEEVLERGLFILQSRMTKYTAFPEGESRRFGEYATESWENFVTTLYEGGELTTSEIDVSKLFTNELVEAFNDFDVDAVREEARSLK